MAMTGPETSSMALKAASLGDNPLFDMVLHRLDHDNGVIDDQADGKDQPEEGEGVDGEAEQREEGEGSHQRHRHRQERDQGGPPPLEEDEDHQDDQDQRLEEGLLDLFHPLGDRQGGVQRHRVVQVGREALLQLLHQLLGAVGRIQGVGPRHLVEGDQGAGLAVEPRLPCCSSAPPVRCGPRP